MATPSDITSDLAALRAQLHESGSPQRALLQLDPWRPIIDLLIDLALVGSSVVAVIEWGLEWAPLAILLLGNRQRALGNLLHDAGHYNLCSRRWVNDGIARWLLAPLLFACLSLYRTTHFRHHQWLGRADADPDFLVPPAAMPKHWLSRFLACAGSGSAWRGSLWGHLVHAEVSGAGRAYIVVWWAVALGLMVLVAGTSFTAHFVGLWLGARATTFYLITTFREMCDHHGLVPGGVFSFTRDVACRGLLRACIHPRNNGYHLTHHLLPAVPYYRLPQAHRLLKQVPIVHSRGQVCDAYFTGPRAVVRAWQSDTNR